jgi:hypothetical protein
MTRRQFIAGLGSAVAWPVVARAQGHHHRQLACTGSAKAVASAFAGVGDWCIVEG